jgi:hypothetical protein
MIGTATAALALTPLEREPSPYTPGPTFERSSDDDEDAQLLPSPMPYSQHEWRVCSPSAVHRHGETPPLGTRASMSSDHQTPVPHSHLHRQGYPLKRPRNCFAQATRAIRSPGSRCASSPLHACRLINPCSAAVVVKGGRAAPSRAAPSRAAPSRAAPSRAAPSRATQRARLGAGWFVPHEQLVPTLPLVDHRFDLEAAWLQEESKWAAHTGKQSSSTSGSWGYALTHIEHLEALFA